MSYRDHFASADQVVTHLNVVVPALTDPFVRSRYAGFVAVVGTTVFELAIKEILIGFSDQKHKVFGHFAAKYFGRINGRIKVDDIRTAHVRRFGSKYEDRFRRRLDELERRKLRTTGQSILSSYGNLITWRHGFAHEGQLPASATYEEVVSAYELGKEVIDCLAGCMNR